MTTPAQHSEPASGRKPRRDDVVDVDVDRIDARGRGEGRTDWNGEPYTVTLAAIPGARVRARVRRRRRARLEADVIEVLAASPYAVEPRCPHVPSCGGCAFQDLDYARQLEELQRVVTEAFEAYDLLQDVAVEPVLGPEHPDGRFHYRNKMEFGFAPRRWFEPHELADRERSFDDEPTPALGLHARGFYGKVIDLQRCAIHPVEFDTLVTTTRRLARERGLSAWDVRSHDGLLRHLVLRKGVNTGELLVDLVTSSDAAETVGPLARELVALHPEITTLVQNVTTRLATVAVGEHEHVLHGPGFIRERVLDLELEISANSFFQTNTRQAERLFGLIRDEAGLGGDEVVWDLYCGTGSIGLVLGRSAGRVVGFEQVASAVHDARRNASRNGIEQATFVEGDVLASLAERTAGGEQPDVIVVDPPRAGLHPKVPSHVVRLGAKRIVYVSCNPTAGARDVATLVLGGYRVRRIRPIDMFPHTPHVECVITLERAREGA